jgi:hypothetical protein
MLMPAAVLVMVVLGALVVDSAVVGMRARALHNAAAAAANDAATAALSPERLRAGVTEIEPARADRVVRAAIEARGLELAAPPVVEVAPDGRTITVWLEMTGRYVFAKAVPGAPDGFRVRARATAQVLAADGT